MGVNVLRDVLSYGSYCHLRVGALWELLCYESYRHLRVNV